MAVLVYHLSDDIKVWKCIRKDQKWVKNAWFPVRAILSALMPVLRKIAENMIILLRITVMEEE